MLTFMPWQIRRHLDRLPLFSPPRPLPLEEAQRVLVFAPHPDDETLGCGGTLARLSSHCSIRVVLVTDGAGAGGLPEGADKIRLGEFRQALEVLGISDFMELHQPDGAFAATPSLIDKITLLIDDFRPDWVFLPSPLDYHRDHVRIATCIEPICRRCQTIKYLLFYEVWAPVPATHIVDITEQVEIKYRALSQHTTALAHGDYARAVDGLNRYRGIYLGKGKSAEAFWVESSAEKRSLFGKVRNICLDLLGRLARPPR